MQSGKVACITRELEDLLMMEEERGTFPKNSGSVADLLEEMETAVARVEAQREKEAGQQQEPELQRRESERPEPEKPDLQRREPQEPGIGGAGFTKTRATGARTGGAGFTRTRATGTRTGAAKTRTAELRTGDGNIGTGKDAENKNALCFPVGKTRKKASVQAGG